MERQIQKVGKRPWGGADFIKLQDELYEALEAMFLPYNRNFVISGCDMSGSGPYTFAAGIVFIDGKICRFAGAQVASLPVFINKQITETRNKTYGDLVDRPTEKHYEAVVGTDASPHIEMPVNIANISGVIAPLSDNFGNYVPGVGASSKAAYLLYQAINNTKPGTIQSGSSAIAGVEYRLADNIVQVKMTFPDTSPLVGASLFTFPANYRPAEDLLIPIGTGGIVKINTVGECTLFAGAASSEPNHYYYFEFPVF